MERGGREREEDKGGNHCMIVGVFHSNTKALLLVITIKHSEQCPT